MSNYSMRVSQLAAVVIIAGSLGITGCMGHKMILGSGETVALSDVRATAERASTEKRGVTGQPIYTVDQCFGKFSFSVPEGIPSMSEVEKALNAMCPATDRRMIVPPSE